jgi:hypothetical protein
LVFFRRIIIAATAVVLLTQSGALAQSGKVSRVGLVAVGTPDAGILGPEWRKTLPGAAMSSTLI